ncbi:MAG: DUF2723 domain-containing protein, partial [Candidatus Marinimicrobia bacterium]|nr:DUF2723 domain-containing protein [Candidatus Neomarinimicrobiota bacterium]
SPLFILLGKIFTLLPTAADPALRMNIMSPVSSALANLLVFLIIIQLVKIWRGGLGEAKEKVMAYAGGFIGAMAFAGTDSHWFNAVEAEVYAMSTFLTALVVWLILVWAEKSEEPGHERYLLLIAYVIGLAIGVHLLNLLALPVIALVIYFRKYEFDWTSFLVTVGLTLAGFLTIYLGIIKGFAKVGSIQYAGEYVGFYLIPVIVIGIVGAAWWAVQQHRSLVATVFMGLTLIVVGYSSYAMIYIRANQDPAINENDPSTPSRLVSYLEREQYGTHSITDRRGTWQDSQGNPGARIADQVNSTFGYVWEYQIKHMYLRYFYWQFLGRSANDGIAPFQFLLLPFLVGFFGLFYHFYRDGKRGLVVMALFIMTGLAIVAYLNQPDPQPRERDYSYVGSFMAFSIWIGLGVSGLIELAYERTKGPLRTVATYGLIALLTVGLPVQMIAKNYHTHDRSGNYVAWDYSYNILQTLEEDAIVFTNGDNDTFPLWYLQEVEGIRKDVKVVNLSLLNTHWYIRQLRDYEPKVLPATFSDAMIDQIYPMQFSARTIEITAPQTEQNPSGKISFRMEPTYGGQAIRVQDIMILRLLEENLTKRPIYFAMTVAPESKLGLDAYLRLDGLAQKVMPYQVNGDVNPEILAENLYEKYQYRNLGNPDVYYNQSITGLLQNYRWSFHQLALNYYQNGQMEKMIATLDEMREIVPEDTIPYTNPDMILEIGRLYALGGEEEMLRNHLQERLKQEDLTLQRKVGYASLYFTLLNDFAKAESIYTEIYSQHPYNGQVVGALLRVYEDQEKWQEAVSVLERWIQANPDDQNARNMLREYRSRLN